MGTVNAKDYLNRIDALGAVVSYFSVRIKEEDLNACEIFNAVGEELGLAISDYARLAEKELG